MIDTYLRTCAQALGTGERVPGGLSAGRQTRIHGAAHVAFYHPRVTGRHVVAVSKAYLHWAATRVEVAWKRQNPG